MRESVSAFSWTCIGMWMCKDVDVDVDVDVDETRWRVDGRYDGMLLLSCSDVSAFVPGEHCCAMQRSCLNLCVW